MSIFCCWTSVDFLLLWVLHTLWLIVFCLLQLVLFDCHSWFSASFCQSFFGLPVCYCWLVFFELCVCVSATSVLSTSDRKQHVCVRMLVSFGFGFVVWSQVQAHTLTRPGEAKRARGEEDEDTEENATFLLLLVAWHDLGSRCCSSGTVHAHQRLTDVTKHRAAE